MKNCISISFRVIIGCALLCLTIIGQTNVEKPEPQPPGRMVDVGGYRLHINCQGNGSPTIVMAAGLGDYSFDWGLIQPEVARKVQVCTYDRAGYAWSDVDIQPRSLQRAVDELQTLLKNASIAPPYIVVGHSWGGLIARVFANQFPNEVVGMVLVDSSHEDRLEVINGKTVRVRQLTRDELMAAFKAEREAEKAREAEDTVKGIKPPQPASNVSDPTKLSPPYDKLPEREQAWRLWARSKGRVADISDYREPLILTFSTRADRQYPLADMSLIVLSSGKNYFENEQGISRDILFADHQKLEADLARLSSRGKLVVAKKSGHHIQLDEPKLVIGAIKNVIRASRSSGKNRKG